MFKFKNVINVMFCYVFKQISCKVSNYYPNIKEKNP